MLVCLFVCVCVFVDMHVADVRALRLYVHAGLFSHVYMYYVHMYLHMYMINIYLNMFGDFNEIPYIFFDVLLTVHLSIIIVISQLNAQILVL